MSKEKKQSETKKITQPVSGDVNELENRAHKFWREWPAIGKIRKALIGPLPHIYAEFAAAFLSSELSRPLDEERRLGQLLGEVLVKVGVLHGEFPLDGAQLELAAREYISAPFEHEVDIDQEYSSWASSDSVYTRWNVMTYRERQISKEFAEHIYLSLLRRSGLRQGGPREPRCPKCGSDRLSYVLRVAMVECQSCNCNWECVKVEDFAKFFPASGAGTVDVEKLLNNIWPKLERVQGSAFTRPVHKEELADLLRSSLGLREEGK